MFEKFKNFIKENKFSLIKDAAVIGGSILGIVLVRLVSNILNYEEEIEEEKGE